MEIMLSVILFIGIILADVIKNRIKNIGETEYTFSRDIPSPADQEKERANDIDPVQKLPVRVAGRRMDMHSFSSAFYYLRFEAPDGSSQELQVDWLIYDTYQNGEVGELTFRRDHFISFIPQYLQNAVNAEEPESRAVPPVRSFPARIVSKSRKNAEAFRYYITFSAPDGSQKELAVDEQTYMLYNYHTDGTLLFRQDLFLCFVPKGRLLPVTYPQDAQAVQVKITHKRREEVPFICTMRFETPDIPRLELDVDPQTYELFFEGENGVLYCHNGEFRGFVPQVLPEEDIDPALFVRRYPDPAQDGQSRMPM